MAATRHRPPAPVIAIAVLALAALAWWGFTRWQASQETADSSRILASGTIEAEESQVSSLLSGRIVSIDTDEGSRVKAGDPLFAIDATLLKLQVDQANAGLRAAKAALRQAKDDDKSDAEIAAAQAQVQQAQAAVSMAKTQVGYATVKSPADGIVTAVAVHVGENAAPGKALATLSDLSALHVSVFVPETQIGRVKLGQTATISADGAPKDYTGTVGFIATESEFTPNAIETKDQRVKLVYEVRVTVEESESFLKPGMPVDVVIEVGE